MKKTQKPRPEKVQVGDSFVWYSPTPFETVTHMGRSQTKEVAR